MSPLCNVVLVSVAQQGESALCTHILSWSCFPSWTVCATLQIPTGYLFYTWSCPNVRATLSIYPTLFFPTVSARPFYLPRLYSCKYVHQCYFSRVHICALVHDICFSLSDLLHSIWQTLGSSTSLQMTQFCSFLWLSNVPWYICTISSLLKMSF